MFHPDMSQHLSFTSKRILKVSEVCKAGSDFGRTMFSGVKDPSLYFIGLLEFFES